MLRQLRLAAVAAALVIAAWAGTAPALEPGDLPGETEAVLIINLRQALNSPIAKDHKDVVEHLKFMLDNELTNQGAQRYFEKMDFDPMRDLDRVTVALSTGKLPDFALLEGKFQPDKVAATAAEATKDHPDHLKEIQVAGKPAYEIIPANGDKTIYACFLGKSRLIGTSAKDILEHAVGRIGSGKKGHLRQELRDAIEAGNDRRTISLVATGPALVRLLEDAPVPSIEALQGLLQSVSALTVAVTLEKNVGFELVVNAKDKQTADQMAKLAGLAVAAGKMMLKKKAEADPKLAPALDVLATMRVISEGNNFVLRGEITPATLDKIIKAVPNK